MSRYSKAIAAVVSAAVTYVIAHYAIDVDAETTGVIVTVLTGLIVAVAPANAE